MDHEHDPIGSIQIYNPTSVAITLQYQQQRAVTTTWDGPDRMIHSTPFQIDFLSILEHTFPDQFRTSVTTPQNLNATCSMTVPPHTHGEIDAFRKVGFSKGIVTFKKYNVIQDVPKFIGYVTESAADGHLP